MLPVDSALRPDIDFADFSHGTLIYYMAHVCTKISLFVTELNHKVFLLHDAIVAISKDALKPPNECLFCFSTTPRLQSSVNNLLIDIGKLHREMKKEEEGTKHQIV